MKKQDRKKDLPDFTDRNTRWLGVKEYWFDTIHIPEGYKIREERGMTQDSAYVTIRVVKKNNKKVIKT